MKEELLTSCVSKGRKICSMGWLGKGSTSRHSSRDKGFVSPLLLSSFSHTFSKKIRYDTSSPRQRKKVCHYCPLGHFCPFWYFTIQKKVCHYCPFHHFYPFAKQQNGLSHGQFIALLTIYCNLLVKNHYYASCRYNNELPILQFIA